MKQKLKWLTAFLWLLSLVLVTWTLSQLPFTALASQLRLLSWNNWLLWIALNAIILWLATKRWQLLAKALGVGLPLGLLFRVRQAGSTVSFLTPGPHFGGEPLQMYWLYRLCRQPLHRAMLITGLDRFVEMTINSSVLLGGILLLISTSLLDNRQWAQAGTGVVSVLILIWIIAALILHQPRWLSARVEQLAHRWHRHPQLRNIHSHWQQLGQELGKALQERKPVLMMALVVSLLGWAVLVAELVVMLQFLGLSPAASDYVLIVIAMRLAMLLPVPGGIGTVEASVLWSFQLLQLPAVAAVGLIALIRLRDAVVLLAGMWCLYRLRQSATSLKDE